MFAPLLRSASEDLMPLTLHALVLLSVVTALFHAIRLCSHHCLQGVAARLQFKMRNGTGLTKQAAAAAASICIAGFASPVMRLFDLSAAAADHVPNPDTSFPLPLMLDTHAITRARADKSRDGYHYFEQASEVTDAAGAEVCAGNSVARVVARLVVKSLCPQT
jgi:hypothetical protein